MSQIRSDGAQACVPIRVEFSDPTEFLDDLRARGPNLEPLVRVTFRKSSDPGGAPITHLTLLASYLRHIDSGEPSSVVEVVELARFVGSVWAAGIDDPESAQARRQADQLRAALTTAIEELGYRVGGGTYLAAPSR